MVWFSEIQKVFNPFGISFITTHGCILFILKLKCFSPLLNDFFFFISASVITWGRDVYIWKICHQRLPHFIPFPYKYVHLWGFNHWHLMHRHISATSWKVSLVEFHLHRIQRQHTDWLYFFYRRDIIAYLGVDLIQHGWMLLSPSQFHFLVKISSQCLKKTNVVD